MHAIPPRHKSHIQPNPGWRLCSFAQACWELASYKHYHGTFSDKVLETLSTRLQLRGGQERLFRCTGLAIWVRQLPA
eukprot:2411837-Pyramimonas_sp.AAC.1